MTMKVKKD